MTAPAAARRLVRRGRHGGSRRPSAGGRRPVAAIALAVAAGALGAPRLAGAAGSGATATLRQQAALIAARITADGAHLDAIGRRYLAAQAARTRAVAAESTARTALARIAEKTTHDRTTLRRAAIAAYVGAGSESALGLFLDGKPNTLDLSQTYLASLAGELNTAVAALGDDRAAHERALTSARRAEQAALAALAAARRERGHALATLAAERQLLAHTRGRLAALVAAAAAARARAAAAAAARRERALLAAAAAAHAAAVRAAAARAAAARAATTTTTSALVTSASAPGTSASGTSAPASAASAPASVSPAAPPPAAPPAVVTSPPAASTVIPSSLASAFAGIRQCESGGDYALDTGNGYYGAYQFSLATWLGLGGSGLPSAAAPADQDAAALRLYEASGWGSWPACAALLGL